MSEERVPEIVLTKKLPQKLGKKSLKIELFPARLWSDKFGPSSPMRKQCAFYSKEMGYNEADLLLRSSDAVKFYRIRIEGCWVMKPEYRYSFYDENYAYQILKNNMP